MDLRRRFYVLKSRPLPAVALVGLFLEVLVFAPILGIAPWPAPHLPGLTLGMSICVLHILASLITGAAFPGWMPGRGTEWGVAADKQASPAKALMETPQVDFYVREMAGGADADLEDKVPSKAQLDYYQRKAEHRLGPFYAGSCLAFPVLASLSAVIVAVYRRVFTDAYGGIIKEYREMVDSSFEIMDLPPDVRGAVVEKSWQAMELRPFIEILGSRGKDVGDYTISAIESVSSLDVTQASRLLRHALSSAAPEARYSAAKALTRIEETLDRELQEAQRVHKFRPELAGPMMRIADARFNYGEISDLDDPVASFHYMEAIRFYERCLDKIQDQELVECQSRLARACLRVDRVPEAKRYFKDLVDKGAQAPSVLRGSIEACYLDRDYPEMMRQIEIALRRCPDSDIIKEAGRIWLKRDQRKG